MTTLEAIQAVYSHLKATDIQSAITGRMCQISRPKSSDKEDVVVNCLGMPNDQLQKTIVNVNLFVPDKYVVIDGQHQLQPDTARLDYLTGLTIPLLTNQRFNGYWFDYQQHRVLHDRESGQHFVNIRVNFYCFVST